MKNLIEQTLSKVTLGAPITHENIIMIPLLEPSASRGEPFYLTLDEALARGVTEITEVSAQGNVPELRVVNKGEKPVFILDGEELVGAKQNRIVNLSILVPANASVTIPVSCVEAGRWRATSRSFSAAPRTQFASSRAKRVTQVTASLRVAGRRYSDQAEVWADIAEKSARLHVDSPTGAMEDIFAKHVDFADKCVEAFRPVDEQCGALLLIGGRVAAMDLFDRPETLRRLLPKLVRSVAIDALDRGSDTSPLEPALITRIGEQFLANLCAGVTQESPGVGAGTDVRVEGPKLSGAALALDTAVLHVAAFSV